MRNFEKTKRIVIKIGTNILSKDDRVDADYIGLVARQVNALLKSGMQVVIVTSGAIGMGCGKLSIGNVETIFLLTRDQYALTSSTYIKQIVALGMDDVQRLSRLVPPNVAQRLRDKFGP